MEFDAYRIGGEVLAWGAAGGWEHGGGPTRGGLGRARVVRGAACACGGSGVRRRAWVASGEWSGYCLVCLLTRCSGPKTEKKEKKDDEEEEVMEFMSAEDAWWFPIVSRLWVMATRLIWVQIGSVALLGTVLGGQVPGGRVDQLVVGMVLFDRGGRECVECKCGDRLLGRNTDGRNTSLGCRSDGGPLGRHGGINLTKWK